MVTDVLEMNESLHVSMNTYAYIRLSSNGFSRISREDFIYN